jgi:hypothetical protein
LLDGLFARTFQGAINVLADQEVKMLGIGVHAVPRLCR